MVLNKKSSTPRMSSLDILRGLAVIFMVEAHIAIIIPFFSELAGIFAAPTFLFVAGVSFQLLLSNRESRGFNTKDKFLEVFWRAVTLLFMTSIITWTADLVLGLDASVFTNIFVIIATGFLVGFVVRDRFRRQLGAIILILILDLLIRAYNVQALFFLAGDSQGLHVSILPYLCFFIFGMITYRVYKHDNFNREDNKILLVYAALFFFLSLAGYLAFPYPFISENRGYMLMLFMVSSLLVILLIVLVRYVDLDGNVKRWLRPVESLGHISFTGYYLSYTSFVLFGTFQFNQPVTANLLIFFSTVVGLVVLEWLWRPQYRYGFEWWYRKISGWALEYTKQYL